MLLGMLFTSQRAAAKGKRQRSAETARTLVAQSWRFCACVCCLQGRTRRFWRIYWQGARKAVGYLWSLGVVAEVIIFAE